MESSTEPRVLGGKYRLVRQLGSGGMGSVWYAEHLVLKSPVAIKLLELDGQSNGAVLSRFLREAQTAASLRSPHVVQILDYGVEGQTPFIVMELLVGESLAERLHRVARLDPSETAAVVTQIARAVGRAHDAGVVHRDLKPANVFVVGDADVEVVKVLDFGIAKAQGLADGKTQSGTFLGTPLYASPEQMQGARALDHRTDIWSLGVLAFECLLGLRPFDGDTFGSIVLAVCVKPLPVPSTLGAVPSGFDAWFAQACARDPERRFSSARQAAEALARICAGEPVANAARAKIAEGAPPEAHAGSSSPAHAATAPDRDESNTTHRAASISRAPELPVARRGAWRWAAALAASSVAVVGFFLLRTPPDATSTPSVTALAEPASLVEAKPGASATAAVADAGAAERPATTSVRPLTTPERLDEPEPPFEKASRPKKKPVAAPLPQRAPKRLRAPAKSAGQPTQPPPAAEPDVDLGL